MKSSSSTTSARVPVMFTETLGRPLWKREDAVRGMGVWHPMVGQGIVQQREVRSVQPSTVPGSQHRIAGVPRCSFADTS